MPGERFRRSILLPLRRFLEAIVRLLPADDPTAAPPIGIRRSIAFHNVPDAEIAGVTAAFSRHLHLVPRYAPGVRAERLRVRAKPGGLKLRLSLRLGVQGHRFIRYRERDYLACWHVQGGDARVAIWKLLTMADCPPAIDRDMIPEPVRLRLLGQASSSVEELDDEDDSPDDPT